MSCIKGIRITKQMVKLFGDAVSDHNPLHFDEQYASTTQFKRPIVHGALLGGLVSGMFVEHYGVGTIYVSTSLQFLRPVHVDSQVTIVLNTEPRREEDRFTKVRIAIMNEDGYVAVSGIAQLITGNKEIQQ